VVFVTGTSHLLPLPPKIGDELDAMFLYVVGFIFLTLAECIAWYLALLNTIRKDHPEKAVITARMVVGEAFKTLGLATTALANAFRATVGTEKKRGGR